MQIEVTRTWAGLGPGLYDVIRPTPEGVRVRRDMTAFNLAVIDAKEKYERRLRRFIWPDDEFMEGLSYSDVVDDDPEYAALVQAMYEYAGCEDGNYLYPPRKTEGWIPATHYRAA